MSFSEYISCKKSWFLPQHKNRSFSVMRKKFFFLFFCTGMLFVTFLLSGQVPGTSGRIYSPRKGNTRYYDASGRFAGSARQSGNRTEYRDRTGRLSGTATKHGNTVTFRDASGRITGSAQQSGSNRMIYRDASGRITSSTTSHGNNVTIRDASGRITGTVQNTGRTQSRRSASGRIVERRY